MKLHITNSYELVKVFFQSWEINKSHSGIDSCSNTAIDILIVKIRVKKPAKKIYTILRKKNIEQ